MKKTMIQIEKKMREGEQPLYYVQINDDLPFGYILTEEQLEELYIAICQHLFDNLLEQNKDILMRLKNNEPAPKMINSDKVIEWLKHCNLSNCDMRTSIIPDSSPTSIPHRVRWLSDDFINKFKKDFGL